MEIETSHTERLFPVPPSVCEAFTQKRDMTGQKGFVRYHEKDKGVGVMRDKEIKIEKILWLFITVDKKRAKGNT